MTTRLTTNDPFETVQRFTDSVQLGYAMALHMDAEQAAGIDGERQYTYVREQSGTLWTIKGKAVDAPGCTVCNGDGAGYGEPGGCTNCGGTGVDPTGHGGSTYLSIRAGLEEEDFPCCGPNGEGHCK